MEAPVSPTSSQLVRSFPLHKVIEMPLKDSDSASERVGAIKEEESKSSFSHVDIEAPTPSRVYPVPGTTPASNLSAEALWLRETIMKQRAEKIRKATERSLFSNRSEVSSP